MLRIEHEKWNECPADLRDRAVTSEHPRTRERFMALYEIASGRTNATHWAAENARHFQSVQSWIHAYNERGPEGVAFRHAGGWAPLFVRKRAP
jgi:SLT domain-containing protein